MNLKRYWVCCVLLILSGCAALGDRTVSVTPAQIQKKLNERLALPFSVLKIFDVQLSNALVQFDQNTGRMQTKLDTALTSKLLGEKLAGQLAVSGKLRFDEATHSIVLDAPEVEAFNVQGMDSQQSELLNALAKTVGGKMLNGLVLYTVKPEDLKLGATQYQPKDLQVTPNGLQITLSPQK